ncbi:MAG: ABC transporter substrate-binding protein [bacterium]
MKLVKFILVSILSIVLAVSLTACGSNADKTAAVSGDKEVVRLAYLLITHALPVFEAAKEAAEKNDNLQIELIKYGSWPELMDALNTGRVDGASVLIELAVKAKEQGIDLKGVALGHRDGNVIVVSKDINNAADLKGKTIAIPHRQSSHNILVQEMLKKAGLSLEEVKIVELAPPEMPSALTQKQIAAYCVAEPFGAKAVVLGSGKILYKSEELWPDSACCALVLNGKFLKNKPEAAKKLVKNYGEAGKTLSSEPYKLQNIAAEYLKQDKKVLDLSLQWISYDNLAITEDIYSVLTAKMKEFGLSDAPPAYNDFVDNTLLF